MAMSRGGSRHGGDREGGGSQVGPDGWAVAGGAVLLPPPKDGDFSQFGKITKSSGGMNFRPSSVFNKKDSKRESISRQPSQNMFPMLS
jgi:translation initiation factor 4G